MKTALITGITGQDGSYLGEFLLAKGYEVHGIVRRASMFNRSRIEHLRADPKVYGERLFLHYADLQDVTSLRRIFRDVAPVEVYHLAGQSHVGLSFAVPESTLQEVSVSTLSILEICRDLPVSPRIYHASSSEVFGIPDTVPQDLSTAFRPENPYGCAKVFATSMCRVYRRVHGLFVVSGIAYNHESPRRGENFVTRKIASAAARWHAGDHTPIEVGNLDAARDWGYAPEYVEAFWKMLGRENPEDFVLATGEMTRLRDFICHCFSAAGIDLNFEGQGLEERAVDAESGKEVLRVSERFFRKVDTGNLVGDPSKAKEKLGWKAETRGIRLAEVLVQAEIDAFV
ncbi:MAG: GDP-mannose 4,6-dehydratase [Verrucomicrobiota bacterium]